jgi:hypothetical protein
LSLLSIGLAGFWKISDGRDVETIERFQLASAASNHPPRSPTRGSGEGGAASVALSGAGSSVLIAAG